jgi:tetratricopeptide (TPR) repeat protein
MQTNNNIAEVEIDRLLAEANLLRIRQQRDEAISTCTRVLRLDAASSTAHSLMGDIYRDEGNYREALGWYKLAVQLDASNAADRKKLDETIDRVFNGVVVDEPQATGHVGDAVTAAPRTRARLVATCQRFLSKLSPMHVIVAFVVIGICAALLLLFLLARGDKKAAPGMKNGATATRNIPMPTPDANAAPGQAPQVTPPADGTGNDGGNIDGLPGLRAQSKGDNPANATGSGTAASPTPAAADSNAGGAAPQPVPPFEPQPKDHMTADELSKATQDLQTALTAALKSSKLTESTLDDVSIDPRSRVVSLSYTIPHMQGPTETKQGLLYTGFKLIWAADKSNNAWKAYVLHGNAYSGTRSVTVLALVANVSPQQADEARDAGDYQTVAKKMSDVWWCGDLENAAL